MENKEREDKTANQVTEACNLQGFSTYVDTCTPVSVKNSKKATHVVVKDVAVMSTS